MESDLEHFKSYLNAQTSLTDNEWNDVKRHIKTIMPKRKNQFSAKSGDLFYLISGFLVEIQDLEIKGPTAVRFFQKGEVFIISSQSELIANEDCTLFRIKVKKQKLLLHTAPNFHQFWEATRMLQLEKYHVRSLFLQGQKKLRYSQFLTRFPGVAGQLTLNQLASYLDINESYLSSIKKLH